MDAKTSVENINDRQQAAYATKKNAGFNFQSLLFKKIILALE